MTTAPHDTPSPQPNFDKIQARLYRRVKRASLDFGLVTPGDHILVCLSGGKDSYTMLSMLRMMQRSVPFPLELTAFHLDQKQPGYPEGVLRKWLEENEISYVIQEEDTYSVVTNRLDPGGHPLLPVQPLATRHYLYTGRGASGVTRSRSATTATTASRRCCSTCCTRARSRRCPRSTPPMTGASRSSAP